MTVSSISKNIFKWTVRWSVSLVLEALFPSDGSENELFSYSPDEIMTKLPRAPQTPEPNTYSLFAYKDERVTDLVWNIKYKKSIKSARLAAFALFQQLIGLREKNTTEKSVVKTMQTVHIVVPMPITAKRRRERGYNQCEVLLDEVIRLDLQQIFRYEYGMLVRTHHSSRQTLKNRQQRIASAKGIFSLNVNEYQKQKSQCVIYIIDDVITTGSTIKEAMEVFRSAGFENVCGISIAH